MSPKRLTWRWNMCLKIGVRQLLFENSSLYHLFTQLHWLWNRQGWAYWQSSQDLWSNLDWLVVSLKRVNYTRRDASITHGQALADIDWAWRAFLLKSEPESQPFSQLGNRDNSIVQRRRTQLPYVNVFNRRWSPHKLARGQGFLFDSRRGRWTIKSHCKRHSLLSQPSRSICLQKSLLEGGSRWQSRSRELK